MKKILVFLFLTALILSVGREMSAKDEIDGIDGEGFETNQQNNQPEPSMNPGGGNSYAVVIGQDGYSRAALSTCINDAKIVNYILVNQMKFPSNNVYRLYDSAAAKYRVKSVMTNLARRSQPNDLMVFYYSGHGGLISGGRGAFLSLVTREHITARELGAWSIGFKGTVLFILDCCHAGGLSNVIVRYHQNNRRYGKNVFHFASSRANQKSYTINRAGYSRFTFYFQKSVLEGHADANSDGKITLRESYNWTHTKLEAFKNLSHSRGRYQEPVLIGQNPDIIVLNKARRPGPSTVRRQQPTPPPRDEKYRWDVNRLNRERKREWATRAGRTLNEPRYIRNRDIFDGRSPERRYNFSGGVKSHLSSFMNNILY